AAGFRSRLTRRDRAGRFASRPFSRTGRAPRGRGHRQSARKRAAADAAAIPADGEVIELSSSLNRRKYGTLSFSGTLDSLLNYLGDSLRSMKHGLLKPLNLRLG